LTTHIVLYVIFRYLLPATGGKDGSGANYPWTKSPSLTAHRIVAFCAMSHWCYLGLKHLSTHDYNGRDHNRDADEDDLAALQFVPAGYEIAQYAFGALLCWDIPLSLIGGSGPTDLMMHLHHAGMLLVTGCVLGFVGTNSSSDGTSSGIVGTHVAPIFFGAIELSSIPLQIVDLFHPNKSPHWNEYVNRSPSTFFPKLCSTSNEISRILFAVLFLLVRGLYFPFVVVRIAIPDFYAEGSLPSTVLMVMCVLFTLLQMYWATLVAGQVKKALSSGGGSGGGGGDGSNKKTT